MADIRAISSNSDFSLSATWFGNVVPGPGDVVFTNGNTVLVSDARIVRALSNLAGTGIVAGGSIVFLNNGDLTATDANGLLYGSSLITTNLSVGQSARLSASTTTSATVGGAGTLIAHGTSGTFNLNGTYLGVNQGSATIDNASTGTLNITGSVTAVGGSGGSVAPGVRLSGSGTINHTGNVFGSSNSAAVGAVNTSVSGTYNLTGNYTGGSNGAGIENSSTGFFNAIGVGRSGTGAPAIGRGGVGQNTRISGPLELGSSGNINPKQCQRYTWATTLIPTYEQAVRSDSSTRRDLYSADNIPTGNWPVANNVVSPTVYGPNNELTGTHISPSPSSVAQGVPVGNTVGTAILTGANVLSALGMVTGNMDTKFSQIPAQVWSNSTRTLTSGGGGGGSSPTATEIAAEVWSTATRTLTTAFPSIPTAADIATAVWNAATRTITTTIPSAIDIAVAVWGAVTRTLTSSSAPTATDVATAVWANTARTITGGTVNTILDKVGYSLTSSERLAIATAVEQSILNENDGQAILNAIVGAIGNTNIDQVTLIAAIRADLERNGGMLAGRSTLTAGGVRAELSTELARLDVAVSSRLAPTGTLSTVTTLTNAPNVPSAATIASQVRTELTTELSRLDVATSTRLASASYSAAPTTAAIRTELSVELARLDTPVSSRLAPSGTLARVTLTDTTTTLTSQPSFPATSEIASAVWSTPSRTVTGGSVDKTGYSLTSAERQAIATAVEQSILNESDGQAILNAIVGAIGNSSVDQVALVAAIRADMERAGGMLSGRSTLTAAQVWAHTSRTITGGTIDNASQTTIAAGEVAAAIRTELNPELERLRNCSTMDTTAAALANALKQ